jgi:glycosyltransferase involved in cell wall biosynthesis
MLAVIVCRALHHPWAGGLQAYARNLIRLLQEMRIEIFVVGSIDSGLLKLASSGTRLFRGYYYFEGGRREPFLKLKLHYISSLHHISKTQQKPIIIHSIDNILPSSIFSHCKGVISINHILTYPNSGLLKVAKILSNQKRWYLAPSSYYLKNLLRNDHKMKSNIVVVPPAIDTDIYRRSHSRMRLKVFNQELNNYSLIVYIGSIHPSRFPYKTIMKTLSKYHDNVKLIVITRVLNEDLPYLETLYSYMKKLKLDNSVQIINKFIAEDEKVNLLGSADAFLSLFREPLNFPCVDPPISLLEAMSCEAIPIVTPFGSIPHLVKSHENGIIVRTHDIENQLLEAFDIILNDKDSLNKMRMNCRKTIEKQYSMDNVKKIMAQFYSQL